jgi:hypothetical protein
MAISQTQTNNKPTTQSCHPANPNLFVYDGQERDRCRDACESEIGDGCSNRITKLTPVKTDEEAYADETDKETHVDESEKHDLPLVRQRST